MVPFLSKAPLLTGTAVVLLFLLLLGGRTPLLAEPATSPVPGMVFVTTNQLATLQKEEDTLRHENALLRKENRALRRQLVKRGQIPVITNSAAKSSVQDQENAKEEYWISPTGKRHNSHCRYFKQGKGKPCAKDDGIPCKICGG